MTDSRLRAVSALSAALVLLLAAQAPGQSGGGEPEIGYLYPAGARQGTIVRVLVGGQNLRGLKGVRITGEGVRGTAVRYQGRFLFLNGEERLALWEQLRDLKAKLGGKPPTRAEDELYRRMKDRQERAEKAKEAKEAKEAEEGEKEGGDEPEGGKKPDPGLIKLTRHPLLGALDELSLEEIEFVERKFLRIDRREQPNAQIGETAMIEVEVDPAAPPGDRELRIITGRGLSNPMCFQVGSLPEAREPAPAGPRAGDTEPVEVPVVLNGQITPGDADFFLLRARKGQRLVFRAYARRLLPFLADAVPGWFQAVLILRDGKGQELAYTDDYRFDPDPVLFFEVPETGVYRLEIRDSIYRGRDDFVYRVAVGEQPFIRSLFPLGGRSGEKTAASITGWNLGSTELTLDTRPDPGSVRFASLVLDGGTSNQVPYAVGELPEVIEAEPNDAPDKAQRVALPLTVNGRISGPGDRDRFCFEGRAGDRIVAEVTARRLLSPLDSLLRLSGPSGGVLAWNDDCAYKLGHLHREFGVLTHHADSYLCATLPADGVYSIEVADAQGRGGEAFAYRLRISPPRGDFALRVTPSAINLQPGRATVIRVHALRRDGFGGEIEVRLKDAPDGFELHGGTIPYGRDSIRMTLRAPNRAIGEPVRLQMEGVARIDDLEVRRQAVPADDEMQAFLWRHLVPAQELVAAVLGRGGRGPVKRVGEGPVRIPRGGSVRVLFKMPRLPNSDKVELELSEAPEGITLSDATVLPDRILVTLRAEENGPAADFADNLIVNAFTEYAPKSGKGKKAKARRVWIGTLPALPVRIVEKEDSDF